MLNPFLEKRLYSSPLQPILIEFDVNEINSLLAKITGFNIPVTSRIPNFGLVALAPVTPKVIKQINAFPGVKMVHADIEKTIFQIPSPEEEWYPTSESRQMLEAEEAIKQGFNGEGVKVGVTDTGVDATHPQLMGTEFYSAISWPAYATSARARAVEAIAWCWPAWCRSSCSHVALSSRPRHRSQSIRSRLSPC